MEYEDLLVEKKENIATITLNVPEKLNALTGKMSRSIKLAADDAELSSEDEELYKQVVSYLDSVDEISISSLQRAFRIGYNRSARIIAMLEMHGLIMPADGSRTRRVIR